MDSILCRPALSNTSVSELWDCHPIQSICCRHHWWKYSVLAEVDIERKFWQVFYKPYTVFLHFISGLPLLKETITKGCLGELTIISKAVLRCRLSVNWLLNKVSTFQQMWKTDTCVCIFLAVSTILNFTLLPLSKHSPATAAG